MQGDPILVDLPNATFLMASETGVIVESSSRAVDSKMKDVYDASKGYTIGFVAFDFKAAIDWSAIVNGTTGLAIAAPGIALTMANQFGIGTAMNGVASGGIYTASVKIDHQGEDLRKISGTAMQRAGVA